MPKINFFTEARMNEFWEYVKMLLSTASPMVLIMVAVSAAGLLITILVRIFRKAAADEEDNDDYEVRHY
ncbi:hypothetical protein [Niallia sp. 03133]|uniref:hypothetical protein n=1 Tax=Niallia sp. 03133 TaxID=3458060 RepID=UPI004044E522